ncbi:hypothetical protein LNK15_00425 [Jeotgalicoccus huakuii]|nr:hypothetical protein [Jeotgalicoccus huakuii]
MNKKYLYNPFVVTSKELRNNSFFDNKINLGKTYLYFNNENKIIIEQKSSVKIVLLGYLVDIRNGNKLAREILISLIEYYNQDINLFIEQLDYMNGRFILIISDDKDTKIFTDATSMLPIYYYQNYIFSSHEVIVREILKQEYEISLENYNYEMKNFLDYTNTKEVYSFNPNLYFSFSKFKFNRIYPRDQFVEREGNEVLLNIKKYLNTQINWLDNNYEKIYLSLTGGLDSKVSLSLVKPIIDKIETFTYMYRFNKDESYNLLNPYKRIYYLDKFIVDNLVYNFRFKHKYFYFEDYSPSSTYLNELNEHVSSHHSYTLSYIINNEIEPNSIHLKSTLFELGKLIFSKAMDNETVLEHISVWAPKEIKSNKEVLMELFLKYKNRNLTDEIIEGHKITSLLYWEFRMGNWHSSLTQETDFTVDIYNFINNRYIIDQIMSINSELRKEAFIFKSIVKENWPALNYFIANSFENLEDVIGHYK